MTEIGSSAASNGHRLVLFDIDGTLLSAGRVARESVLAALTRAYGWQPLPEHQDRQRHDFSGKTDPQIVRELVTERLDATGSRKVSPAHSICTWKSWRSD